MFEEYHEETFDLEAIVVIDKVCCKDILANFEDFFIMGLIVAWH